MSVYDESPRWSDESVSDSDDTAEMTIRRPLFENNFLQRWIERDGGESEHEDDDEDDEDDPRSSITKRFRSTFKRLFPKLAETRKEDTPKPTGERPNITEAVDHNEPPVSEVEISIPHAPSERTAESAGNAREHSQLAEKSSQSQNANVANETIVSLREDIADLPEAQTRKAAEVMYQEPLRGAEEEPMVEAPRVEHIAVPLAAMASDEIAKPNKTNGQLESEQHRSAQKNETKTQEKPHKESWYQRLQRKRKERKVKNRLQSLEKQVKTLEDDTSKLRKKNAALQTVKAEQKPPAAKEMVPLQAAQHTVEKRDTRSHQEAPLRSGVRAETTPKPPRQAEIKATPEKSIKGVPPEKPEKADRPQRNEAVREQASRGAFRQERQPDLEIIDDNIREAEFDKRHEIMDAQVDAKLSYERLDPPDELPPLVLPEKVQPRSNTSTPTSVGKILKEKEPLKQLPVHENRASGTTTGISYAKATTAGFVFAATLAVIGLIAYILTS